LTSRRDLAFLIVFGRNFSELGFLCPFSYFSGFFAFSKAFFSTPSSKALSNIARFSSKLQENSFLIDRMLRFFIKGWASLHRERAILLRMLRFVKSFLFSRIFFMDSAVKHAESSNSRSTWFPFNAPTYFPQPSWIILMVFVCVWRASKVTMEPLSCMRLRASCATGISLVLASIGVEHRQIPLEAS